MGICESRRQEIYRGHKPVPTNIILKSLKSICKIKITTNKGYIYGTGFFMNISDSKKNLITNYHIINPNVMI